MEQLRILQDEERVLVIKNGVLLFELPADKALELAQAIASVAKKAEEHLDRDSLIRDAAILARAGVPVGLALDPRIQEEARKAALYDRELRKNIPLSAGSKGVVSAPTVKRGK